MQLSVIRVAWLSEHVVWIHSLWSCERLSKCGVGRSDTGKVINRSSHGMTNGTVNFSTISRVRQIGNQFVIYNEHHNISSGVSWSKCCRNMTKKNGCKHFEIKDVNSVRQHMLGRMLLVAQSPGRSSQRSNMKSAATQCMHADKQTAVLSLVSHKPVADLFTSLNNNCKLRSLASGHPQANTTHTHTHIHTRLSPQYGCSSPNHQRMAPEV